MEELEVTWGRAARIWWSIAWRSALAAGVVGIAIGVLVGIALGAAGRPDLARQFGQLLGIAVAIPVGIWAVKAVLSKEYRQFRVALISSAEATLGEIVSKMRMQ